MIVGAEKGGVGVRRNSYIYSLNRTVAQGIFPLLYRIEMEREEDLHFNGPAVILPKHQYWTDIPLVGLSFNFPLFFVAKRELFRYPGIRSYISLLGGIPLDRERSVRTLNSIRYLLSRLKAAEKVVIFPEGTYFRDVVGAGKNRLVKMILRFQSVLGERIPFVPVGIRYGERMGWRRRVEIRIGHPLFAEKESDSVSLTDRVMEEIARLCGLPRSSENKF